MRIGVSATGAALGAGLAAAGCDPVNNPAAFGIGITVAVVGVTFVALVPVIILVARLAKGSAERSRILSTGQPAQAQVLALQETGTRINDQPVVSISLLVQPQGGSPYQASSTVTLSQLHIPRVQPGMMVPVKVDPQDPQKVALDTSALLSTPAMGMMMGGQPGMMGGQPGMMAGQPGMMAGQPGMMGGQPGMAQYGAMSQQQAMAMAQAAMAQPPAGGAIVHCPSCGGPYAVANPRCPHCGAPRPQA